VSAAVVVGGAGIALAWRSSSGACTIGLPF
jgi:hypothetical protein